MEQLEITPEQAGLERMPVEQVGGGSPTENAQRLIALLSGEGRPADRSIVALNAAALLMTAGRAPDLRLGVAMALDSIGSGRAKRLLDDFVEASRG
jgi:anthranilate phosphoribosyltransferase